MILRDWRGCAVKPEQSLREAMEVIERGRHGIALVVDQEHHLLGTLTDGDVRRAILRELSLKTPVGQVMCRDYTWLPDGTREAVALELMQVRLVKQLPLLDPERRVVGLWVLPDLLAQAPRPNWALIMAGGEGRRLRPLTEKLPKPMLPVGGQPLLEIAVGRLVSHGFRRLFLAVHYRREQIEEHFGDGGRFGCRIDYLRESQPLGTGGALRLLPELPQHPLLVINGDLLTDVSFSALLDYHAQHQGAATLCVREVVHEIPYGVVECDGDRVCGFQEKPVQRTLINAGMYVLEPRLLRLLPDRDAYPLPQLLADARQAGEVSYAFLVHEDWADIGSPADYERFRHQSQDQT